MWAGLCFVHVVWLICTGRCDDMPVPGLSFETSDSSHLGLREPELPQRGPATLRVAGFRGCGPALWCIPSCVQPPVHPQQGTGHNQCSCQLSPTGWLSTSINTVCSTQITLPSPSPVSDSQNHEIQKWERFRWVNFGVTCCAAVGNWRLLRLEYWTGEPILLFPKTNQPSFLPRMLAWERTCGLLVDTVTSPELQLESSRCGVTGLPRLCIFVWELKLGRRFKQGHYHRTLVSKRADSFLYILLCLLQGRQGQGTNFEMISRRAANVGNRKKTIHGFLPFPWPESFPFPAYQRKHTRSGCRWWQCGPSAIAPTPTPILWLPVSVHCALVPFPSSSPHQRHRTDASPHTWPTPHPVFPKQWLTGILFILKG